VHCLCIELNVKEEEETEKAREAVEESKHKKRFGKLKKQTRLKKCS
jgi:hypothetical protein|tara:strand:+ start:253 stop:390 length:138 start_codon:yes stop_codon:yes gene_type:complete